MLIFWCGPVVTLIIAFYLKKIFNDCMQTGIYPDILKIAYTPTVHNKGSKEKIENYRPMSILSPFNKIFEKILHQRLFDYWEKNNVLSDQQFGFRKNRSTNLAVTYLYETILQLRDGGHKITSTFLDLAKAFDSVNHKILLSKLEHYEVRVVVYQLMKSYLSNRMQYVSTDAKYSSNMCTVETNVPQGSVLGPLLFLIYINDLPNSINSKGLCTHNAILVRFGLSYVNYVILHDFIERNSSEAMGRRLEKYYLFCYTSFLS